MTIKFDWRFSVDGDLVVGPPKTNEEGELLYLTAEGDEVTDETLGVLIRDIPIFSTYLVDKQVINNRMRTENPEWFHHPEIGPSLSQLIGEPNTRETGEKGKALIVECLTKDGFISPNDLEVNAIPYDIGTILFRVVIQRYAHKIILAYGYDLTHGILTEYEVGAD